MKKLNKIRNVALNYIDFLCIRYNTKITMGCTLEGK